MHGLDLELFAAPVAGLVISVERSLAHDCTNRTRMTSDPSQCGKPRSSRALVRGVGAAFLASSQIAQRRLLTAYCRATCPRV